MTSTLTRDVDEVPHHYYKLTHAKDRWIISDPMQATKERPKAVLASLGDALGIRLKTETTGARGAT